MRSSAGFRLLFAAPLWPFLSLGLPATYGEDSEVRAPEQTILRRRANLEPASEVDIRSEVGQEVRVRYVAPAGKRVKKDTLVVELDASTLVERAAEQRSLVEQARSEVIAAEASLEAANAEAAALVEVAELGLAVAESALKTFLSEGGEYQLELGATEKEIAIAEKRLDVYTSRWKRLKEIAKGEELADMELAVAEVKAKLEAAKAKRRFLEEYLRDNRTAELKLAIAEHKLELVRARNDLKSGVLVRTASLAAARSELDGESRKLARLEQQLGACKIYAPREGTVLHPGPTPLEAGSTVRDGQILIRVADSKRFKLEVNLGLEFAPKLPTGQSVAVRLDAFPDRTFPGHITRARVLPAPKGPPEEFMVTVRVDDLPESVKVGLAATVEFDLSSGAPR